MAIDQRGAEGDAPDALAGADEVTLGAELRAAIGAGLVRLNFDQPRRDAAEQNKSRDAGRVAGFEQVLCAGLVDLMKSFIRSLTVCKASKVDDRIDGVELSGPIRLRPDTGDEDMACSTSPSGSASFDDRVTALLQE